MQVPFIGDVGTATLIFTGISALSGYILGSQIKTALKIIVVLVSAVIVACFALNMQAAQTVSSFVSLYAVLRPVLDEFLAKFQASLEPSLLAFASCFMVGLWKG